MLPASRRARALWIAAAVVLAGTPFAAVAARAAPADHPLDTPVSWSPDGRWIVVSREGTGTNLIVHPSGRGVRRLAAAGYSWSPTGSALAFTTSDVDSFTSRSGIALMRGLGAAVQKLTHPRSGEMDGFPRWSPDGAWIAFQRTRFRKTRHHLRIFGTHIWLIRKDGSELHRLTSNGRDDEFPSWSPDTRSIAFQRPLRGGKCDIFVKNLVSGRELRLTHRQDNQQPQWSPRSDEIIFIRSQNIDLSGQVDVYSVRADGSRFRDLTPYTGEDTNPVWSPNGRWIAFEVDSRRDDPYGDFGQLVEIWLMRPNGSGQHPLFRRLNRKNAPYVDQSPVWSPDSRRIAFSRFRPGRDGSNDGASVHVVRSDGTHLLRLTY